MGGEYRQIEKGWWRKKIRAERTAGKEIERNRERLEVVKVGGERGETGRVGLKHDSNGN